MQGPTSKTTALFSEPFRLPGLDEWLPAGEYELETEIDAPLDNLDPERWEASVMVRLHPRHAHPGLNRTLTVPLAALEQALARDKLPDRSMEDAFIEHMLSDPMVRLVMAADRVSDVELRQLYARASDSTDAKDGGASKGGKLRLPPDSGTAAALQRAENEGMPPYCAPDLPAGTGPVG
jgi:hypothetical protein